MSIYYVIDRYGKYLGGLDVRRIREMLEEEARRLREVERIIVGEDLSVNVRDDVLRVECLRLAKMLEMLRSEERRIVSLLVDVKAHNTPRQNYASLLRDYKTVRRKRRVVVMMMRHLGCDECCIDHDQ